MKEKNKRDLYLKVRVSQEEMDAIKHKFHNSGMQTLSGFIRTMIFESYIIQMDGNKLQEICKFTNNIFCGITILFYQEYSRTIAFSGDLCYN